MTMKTNKHFNVNGVSFNRIKKLTMKQTVKQNIN